MINATVALIDSYGRRTTKRVEVDKETLAEAVTAMEAYAPDLLAVTDLGILYVTFSMRDDAEAAAGDAGANVDVGATFSVLTDEGKGASHKVPGFDVTLVGGLGTIDVTQTEITNYFANFATGAALRLSDGEAVAEVLSGTLDR